MRAITAGLALALGLSAGLGPAAQTASADTALLIVNDRYRNAQNLRTAAEIEDLRRPLRQSGFDVVTVWDGDAGDMRAGLNRLLQADEEDRIVIALVGHFARSASDSWLLASNANAPSLATVGGQGLSLDVVMDVASSAPGRSIVLLAQERRRMELGQGLGAGIGRVDPPNGVTAIAGAPEELADLMRDGILVPGTDLPTALEGTQGVRPFGFLGRGIAFLPAPVAETPDVPRTPPVVVQPVPSQPSPEETALWNAAQELDTAAAFRAYLSRYPGGFFEAEARARLNTLENDPTAQSEAAEEALALTRQQRRGIQRDLNVLGFYDRGIDGIFGSGTRSAVAAWQSSRGIAATGYLDQSQITALGDQAALRRAQIEEEERIAREAAEREDRAYWQVTGQGSDEDGLRAYLDRYPEGLFADRARSRLRDYDEADWQRAAASGNLQAFVAYLEEWPNGLFADEARTRIEQLRPSPGSGASGTPGGGLTAQQIAQFEAREAALNLAPVTRSIIEQRLAAMGLQPGRVDGRFDSNTRQAIAQYQASRGLDVSGYLNQVTVARLLSEALGGVIRLDGVLR